MRICLEFDSAPDTKHLVLLTGLAGQPRHNFNCKPINYLDRDRDNDKERERVQDLPGDLEYERDADLDGDLEALLKSLSALSAL